MNASPGTSGWCVVGAECGAGACDVGHCHASPVGEREGERDEKLQRRVGCRVCVYKYCSMFWTNAISQKRQNAKSGLLALEWISSEGM